MTLTGWFYQTTWLTLKLNHVLKVPNLVTLKNLMSFSPGIFSSTPLIPVTAKYPIFGQGSP